MALDNKDRAILLLLGIDEAMLKGRGAATRAVNLGIAATLRAARAGISVALPAARAAIPLASRFAAANPITTGAALGGGFLATPPGQELLAMAAESGRSTRDAFDQDIEDIIRAAQDPRVQSSARKKVSSYNKAVKVGMAALKGSKYMGKKGTINNAKKAFATVNKTVSALKRGKKVRRTGATGVVARKTSKLPGISSIKVRK